MNDVMVDLETLGVEPGCIILSIGAVSFDSQRNELGPGFYKVINRKTCQRIGLFENPATIEWWSQQNNKARQILEESISINQNTNSISNVLLDFNNYLNMFNKDRDVKVWGNGSDFDNAILEYVYRRLGIQQEWKFKHNRCFRTLKSLFPNIEVERYGTYHNAYDDAITQALHAIKILRRIK